MARGPGKKQAAKAAEPAAAAETAAPAAKPVKLRANGWPAVDPEILRLRSLRHNDPPSVIPAEPPPEPARQGKPKIGRRIISPSETTEDTDPVTDKLLRYAPYERQREFHAAGAAHRERLFMAGNQLGKTTAGRSRRRCMRPGFIPRGGRGGGSTGRRSAGPPGSPARRRATRCSGCCSAGRAPRT